MASAHPDDYERTDADPRLIAMIALGLGLFLAATPFVLGAIWPSTRHAAALQGAPQPPEPRLEIHPREALARLRASEDALLTGYGWVDRQQGVVRIPIDRAAAALAQRGLTGWSAVTRSAP